MYGNGDIKVFHIVACDLAHVMLNLPLQLIAVDCGIKYNIIRALVNKGATVKVVPWDYDFSKELQTDYHGLFLSNGPGDPAKLDTTIDNLRKAMDVGTIRQVPHSKYPYPELTR